MLTPEWLKNLPEPIIKLFQDLEDWVIADIARRIRKMGEATSTAELQREALQATGAGSKEIQEKLAETLDKSKEEVERLFSASTQI